MRKANFNCTAEWRRIENAGGMSIRNFLLHRMHAEASFRASEPEPCSLDVSQSGKKLEHGASISHDFIDCSQKPQHVRLQRKQGCERQQWSLASPPFADEGGGVERAVTRTGVFECLVRASDLMTTLHFRAIGANCLSIFHFFPFSPFLSIPSLFRLLLPVLWHRQRTCVAREPVGAEICIIKACNDVKQRAIRSEQHAAITPNLAHLFNKVALKRRFFIISRNHFVSAPNLLLLF